MKFYSNHGKYSGGTRPRGPKRRMLLLIPLAVLILALGAVGVFLLSNHNADNDFQQLAAQVQEHVPETTALPAGTTDAAETTGETTAAATVPTEETVSTILPQYAGLYEQNADLFGWIRIDDTVIDYPVMHTPDDPEKYLHTNFEGEYSYSGVPFLDAACTADSDNLLIYGHNMPNGSMFRSIMKYQEKTYWEKYPTITFNTLYKEQEYEVLAAFYDRVYYKTETCFKFYQFIDAADETDFDNAIVQFQDKALYDTGVEASYGDKLITLVTCAYHTDNGRFVVVARRK